MSILRTQLKKILFIHCLFVMFTVTQVTLAKQNCRNIIILLDQEGDMENIGRPLRFFLTNKLQSALNEEASPILINASLWNNFIERRLAIQQMSQVADSPEKNALESYNRIGECLTHWIEHYKEQNIDPMQAIQLAVEKINEEFYFKDISESNKAVSREASIALISYLTSFNANNWEFYSNGKGFYLLIPKKYLQRLQKKESLSSTSKNLNLSEKELLLGLKVNHLIPLSHIEDSVVNYLNQIVSGPHLTHFLSDFFVTKEDLCKCTMPFRWNIIFSGHGGFRYKEISGERVTPWVEPIIADLTVSEFHSMLEFCENSINTNCFHYHTCYGSGNHIKMLYENYGNPVYNYTIISGCISDGYATCLYQYLPFPNAEKTPLKQSDITRDNEGNWHLKVDHKYEWTKFFSFLEENLFEQFDLTWLIEGLPLITYHRLCDNPLIRLPKSSSFVPILTNEIITISDALVSLKQSEKAKNITIQQKIILVDARIVPIPLIINTPAYLTSISSGSSQHYFEKIEFTTNVSFLDIFVPVEGNILFDKHFIIQELIINNDKTSTISKFLDIDSDKIIAHNVVVHTIWDSLIRIFAEINKNYYMITINKTDYSKEKSELKNIQKMSKESTQIYLKKYDELKDQIIKSDKIPS